MRGNDAVTAKKARMQQALGMIKAMGSIEYTKAVAILSFNIGLSETKAREYIRMFKDLGKIKIDSGTITPVITEETKRETAEIDKMLE